MNFSVNLNSEEIQKAIVQSITDSSIGLIIKEQLEKMLTEKVKQPDYTYKTIIHAAAEEEIKTIICKMIKEEIENNEEKIIEMIKPFLNKKVIENMVKVTTEVMLGNLKLH
jgi:Glu-tRNA(Gln) amidotransferase subunit E-like FAD-binding protein